MSNTPRLLHGKQRITTDATLRSDLEASLRVTGMNDRLARLEQTVTELHASQVQLIDAVQTLGGNCDRILMAMAAVVKRAEAAMNESVQ